jgi:uncharacterized protein (TIGR01244 family)
MDIREITTRYYVSPQIDAEDMSKLKTQGFTCVICNRPDEEIPASHHALAMERAAKDAGLEFVINPLTHDTMTDERLALQRATLEGAEGKVLAYCASGTRSTVAWVLGHADSASPDALLEAAAKGGYHLEALRGRIEFIAEQKR